MIQTASKTLFSAIAGSSGLKTLASRFGMRGPRSFARRFIAGETVEEAIAAARIIEASGFQQTLDLLGESVASMAEADAATRAYLDVLDKIVASGVGRNISLKLTQLGLSLDRATCVDNLRRILDVAQQHGFFVRIDMENSPFTQVTLDVFETMWEQGYRNVGVVLQSCLPRSLGDAKRMNELGARVRIVKGAYKEPRAVAYQEKEQVDAAFLVITKLLLSGGTYPAIATHDPAMITAARAYATEHGIAHDKFEFQMLFGIRRDLQAALSSEGYNVRVYIPFGREWFPYFMRRLGERPANIGFVVRGILSER
ncbi:MAG: proline dehydrogenase family protein [Acidobacteriota bacterium]|nr:proline dehydrogenase family protein [Acidobacteriota bacterium]